MIRFLFFVICFGGTLGYDYCLLVNENTCPVHVGCNQTESLLYQKNVIELKLYQKLSLLHLYNSIKNDLALGQLKPHKTAANISTVAWNDELEHLAGVVAQYYLPISYQVDKCLDTPNYKNNKQESHETFNNPGYSVESLILSLDKFYRENMYEEGTLISFSHLTDIGCQYFTYKDFFYEWHGGFRCILNFESKKFEDFQTYVGGEPCSGCLTACHSMYKGLCV